MLNEQTIMDAFNVPAYGQGVGRAYIDGSVLIYDLDDIPSWVQVLLDGRDDDGLFERRKDGGAEFAQRFPYADDRSANNAG